MAAECASLNTATGRWPQDYQGLIPAAANKEEDQPRSHVDHTNVLPIPWQVFPWGETNEGVAWGRRMRNLEDSSSLMRHIAGGGRLTYSIIHCGEREQNRSR